jgi:hypothetical protein
MGTTISSPQASQMQEAWLLQVDIAQSVRRVMIGVLLLVNTLEYCRMQVNDTLSVRN